MTILTIYDFKDVKKNTQNFRETDLIELKSLGEYGDGSHPEFLKIPSLVIGGKTIMEWFSVDDICYWWFVAPIINEKFNQSAYFVDNFLKYIEKHPISKLILKTNFDKKDLIEKICLIKNIDLEISYRDNLIWKLTNYKKLIKKLAYKKITNSKNKKRLNCLPKLNTLIPKNSIIFSSAGVYRRDMVYEKTANIEKKEFFIQPMLDYLYENNIPTTCFDVDYTFRGDTKILKERISASKNWFPIELIFNPKKSNNTIKTIQKLKKSISHLLDESKNEKYYYHSIPIFDYFTKYFDEIFYEPNLPTYIDLIESAESFFKKYSPKTLVQVYEQGPFAKSLQIAANKLGIKTIGIQHGLITETTHDYMHYEIQSDSQPLGNQIPDVTCVFGTYYKKLLTEKGNYPKSKVMEIGNPPYYQIEKKIEVLEKLNPFKEYGFSKQKIILIPLANLKLAAAKDNYDFILLSLLNNAFQYDESIKILVRPHPGSSFDKKSLEKLFPNNNFVISRFSLFEDIHTCNVIVTPMSTVGIDGTVFGKPVIFVNVTADKTPLSEFQNLMIKYEVAKVCNVDNLLTTIKSTLKNEFWNKDNEIKKNQFLEIFFNFGKSINFSKLLLE